MTYQSLQNANKVARIYTTEEPEESKLLQMEILGAKPECFHRGTCESISEAIWRGGEGRCEHEERATALTSQVLH